MSSNDQPDFVTGSVPWSPSECVEVMQWYHDTVSMPKDDWDLSEQGIRLEDESGVVSDYRFNMFHPMNQLGLYMAKRYDLELMCCHTYRFLRIMDFLSQHHQELIRGGFARQSDAEPVEINGEVLEALCTLSFSKSVKSDDGDTTYLFDYDEVVSKARTLEKERE